MLKYAIITPARNEADLIELTIKSVLAQTVKPIKWVIVSDGSTDGTNEIVDKYAVAYPWIELVRMPERSERNFAGKVMAFNAGYERLKSLDFDVIASLDADLSFDPEYFSFLLQRLKADQSLGLVGTPFKELTGEVYDYRFANIEHVSGACQVFRRKCFEEIGGYVSERRGSIDHIAVVTARMKGWGTRTFTEKVSFHHRSMGTAQQNLLMARFKNGQRDHLIGNHPLWEIFRSLYQMTRKPVLLGGGMVLLGYISAAIKGETRPVSPEFVAFVRHEQVLRLWKIIRKAVFFVVQAPFRSRRRVLLDEAMRKES